MSYKLLFVDDETLFREAVIEQMNWEQHGFTCIGDCEDGVAALEKVNEQEPHVVITDIGMPFMDGIELTRRLSEQFPKVKVIILTGYGDFEYAQQALRLHAVDYILKPITATELGDVLHKMKLQLDFENSNEQRLMLLQQQLHENIPLLRERFFEQLMTTSISKHQLQEGKNYFNIVWHGEEVVELAIAIDDFTFAHQLTTSDRHLVRFGIFNVSQEVASSCEYHTATYRDREQNVFIILSADCKHTLQQKSMDIAEQVIRAVESYLPVRISIGIGEISHVSNLITAHQTSLAALDYRLVTGQDSVIRLSDVKNMEQRAVFPIASIEANLLALIKTGSKNQLMEVITHFIEMMRKQFISLDICRMFVQRLVFSTLNTLFELDPDLLTKLVHHQQKAFAMKQLESVDQLEQWLMELCNDALDAIKQLREDVSGDQIGKAVQYINDNFADSELSLSAVSKHVAMNPSYLSTIFKQHIGKSFVELLTDIRMEKAKQYLHMTAMKSYEIAYAVGYRDPHYFSAAFKKHTGDTPTEYRNKRTAKA